MSKSESEKVVRFREEAILTLGTVGAVDIAALIFVLANKSTGYFATLGVSYVDYLAALLGASSLFCLFASLFMIEQNAGLARKGRSVIAHRLSALFMYMGLAFSSLSVVYLVEPVSLGAFLVVSMSFAVLMISDITLFHTFRTLEPLVEVES